MFEKNRERERESRFAMQKLLNCQELLRIVRWKKERKSLKANFARENTFMLKPPKGFLLKKGFFSRVRYPREKERKEKQEKKTKLERKNMKEDSLVEREREREREREKGLKRECSEGIVQQSPSSFFCWL